MTALCRVAAGSAVCFALAAFPGQVGSETTNQIMSRGYQMMSRACPSALAKETQGNRQMALDDPERYETFQQAAGLYYDCAQRLSDAHARDWAKFLYAYDLALSANTAETWLGRSLIAQSAANDLAASTRFPDVRKIAIEFREDVRKMYRQTYNELYGHYPDATPEPMPTD
jgi:hypothetical protein